MDESNSKSPCKECNNGVGEAQLHAEVENLQQHLAEKDAHIVGLDAEFVKCTTRANDLEEQVDTWREKYERLYDSHKRVQKLNQVLEDKLLQIVDKMKSEKSQLTKDIATLSVRLAESKHNYSMLQKENERYKNDMNLAIQLLQCKPDNFVSQKLDSLPVDTQARVSQYVMSKTSKPASSSQSKTGNDLDTFDAMLDEVWESRKCGLKYSDKDAILETSDTWRRQCGCIRTSDKLRRILDCFPAPPPPSPASVGPSSEPLPNTSTCISAFCTIHQPSFLSGVDEVKVDDSTGAAIPSNEKLKEQVNRRSWYVVSELVQLVQLSVTATALALYYLIYCYMQLVYYTLRSALYFHNADGPMKITIGVVTLTSLIVGFNLLLRMERLIFIFH